MVVVIIIVCSHLGEYFRAILIMSVFAASDVQFLLAILWKSRL